MAAVEVKKVTKLELMNPGELEISQQNVEAATLGNHPQILRSNSCNLYFFNYVTEDEDIPAPQMENITLTVMTAKATIPIKGQILVEDLTSSPTYTKIKEILHEGRLLYFLDLRND